MFWFCEKMTRIRQAVNRLIEELEKEPQKIEINRKFWNSPEEYIKDRLRLQLGEIGHVNEALFRWRCIPVVGHI
jgi:DNA-directed RNA polymerase specialized sigma subunit